MGNVYSLGQGIPHFSVSSDLIFKKKSAKHHNMTWLLSLLELFIPDFIPLSRYERLWTSLMKMKKQCTPGQTSHTPRFENHKALEHIIRISWAQWRSSWTPSIWFLFNNKPEIKQSARYLNVCGHICLFIGFSPSELSTPGPVLPFLHRNFTQFELNVVCWSFSILCFSITFCTNVAPRRNLFYSSVCLYVAGNDNKTLYSDSAGSFLHYL